MFGLLGAIGKFILSVTTPGPEDAIPGKILTAAEIAVMTIEFVDAWNGWREWKSEYFYQDIWRNSSFGRIKNVLNDCQAKCKEYLGQD
ncbi:MAG: hypothetical protein PHI40_07715 [Caldisericia bacterium]|nr:hypothetical protein [Caldisericia bacterium]MDD4615269.1 hypothetical protein [Caldisericia bacterium]